MIVLNSLVASGMNHFFEQVQNMQTWNEETAGGSFEPANLLFLFKVGDHPPSARDYSSTSRLLLYSLTHSLTPPLTRFRATTCTTSFLFKLQTATATTTTR